MPAPSRSTGTAPRISDERLRTILGRERDGGAADRLVRGGLDRLLARFAAGGSKLAGRLLETLPDGYGALTTARRRRWLRDALGDEPATVVASTTPAGSPRAAGPQPADPLATPLESADDLGLSQRQLAALRRLGLETAGDLLRHYPYRYDDYSRLTRVADLRVGEERAVAGTLHHVRTARTGGRPATRAVLHDATGRIDLTWFNMPHLVRRLQNGARVAVRGKVRVYHAGRTMANPEWMPIGAGPIERPLLPVYRTTRALPAAALRELIDRALASFGEHVAEPLDPAMRSRHQLMPAREALAQIHYPASHAARTAARRSAAFAELLAIQFCVVRRKRERQAMLAAPLHTTGAAAKSFVAALPFTLTPAQHGALAAIQRDLAEPRPMGRLLQGDVGSGKTVVALAAMLEVVAAGAQAALMAPTEVLAEQHYRTITTLLGGGQGTGEPAAAGAAPRRVHAALLTGATPAAERRRRVADIAGGRANIIVGTHALIQESVSFADLALAIIDEQHRFGVMQRAALRVGTRDDEATAPHLLVMTATPIPRSLALTLYGDLDISVIDELPPGRTPVQTRYLSPGQRHEAFAFVRSEVAAGRQAFVICPLVEGSAAVQSRAATAEFERLRYEEFPEYAARIELVHGRMSAAAKDAAMQRFASGAASILVATSVVEVGIDVPNASVIVIEGAGRFGLAQLHQFRGRVGRGQHPSHCLLLDDDPAEEALARLALLERHASGFDLAQADLELRGPGQPFGTQQSGKSGLLAAWLLDTRLISAARAEAERLLNADPGLDRPQHAALRALAERAAADIVTEAH